MQSGVVVDPSCSLTGAAAVGGQGLSGQPPTDVPGSRFRSMIVPFSVNDFLARALAVYGERVGVVDEPMQPAPSSAT